MKYLLIIFLFFSNIAYTQMQAVGDVMLGESKKNLFNPVLDDFKNENYINLINLEGVVSDPLNNKKCLNQKNCFTFLQKLKVIDFLKEAKVQVVNLANNHVMDFDIQGLENTINHLSKINTHIIGLSNHNFKELSFKNKKLELYKNKLIAYSLGNFITYGQFDLSNNLSLWGILRVELKNNGDFSHAYFWKNEVALIQSDESFQFLKKITTEHSKKIQSKEITFNEMTYEIR